MPTPSSLAPDEILAAMGAATQGHVSVSRGALPFVIPCAVRVCDGGLIIDSPHPSVVRGAERHDIAALQVEARLDGQDWSLSATGPLDVSADGAWIAASSALFSAECLSSPHGHSIDPLLRSGLAERA